MSTWNASRFSHSSGLRTMYPSTARSRPSYGSSSFIPSSSLTSTSIHRPVTLTRFTARRSLSEEPTHKVSTRERLKINNFE